MADIVARKCSNHECAVEFVNAYAFIEDKEVCSPRCYGGFLAGIQFPFEEKRKPEKGEVGSPVSTAVIFTPAPEDKVVPSKTRPQSSRIKFERNIYKAEEIVILVKVGPDMPVRVLGTMRDVYAYTDKGGLLLRPNMGGVQSTFADIPKAIAIAATPFRRRHKQGQEEAQAEEKKQEKVKRIFAQKNAPVEGASYGNPSQDNRSRRFFFIESMLMGGTSVEIVERADLLAHKSGIYRRGEITRSIPSNPANVRAQYERVKKIWHKQGVIGKVIERDNYFRVEIVKK